MQRGEFRALYIRERERSLYFAKGASVEPFKDETLILFYTLYTTRVKKKNILFVKNFIEVWFYSCAMCILIKFICVLLHLQKKFVHFIYKS